MLPQNNEKITFVKWKMLKVCRYLWYLRIGNFENKTFIRGVEKKVSVGNPHSYLTCMG